MMCVCLPSDAYRATCAPARESAATSWASSTASPPPGPHRPAAPAFRRKVVTWYATAPRSGDRCLRPLRGERRYLVHRCAVPPDRPIAIGSVCVCFRGLYRQAQHLRPSRAAGAPLAPQVQTDARSPRPLGRYPCASGANVVTCYTSASRHRRVRLRPLRAGVVTCYATPLLPRHCPPPRPTCLCFQWDFPIAANSPRVPSAALTPAFQAPVSLVHHLGRVLQQPTTAQVSLPATQTVSSCIGCIFQRSPTPSETASGCAPGSLARCKRSVES